MTRDHFKKVMYSPHFQSNHYDDSASGIAEKKMLESLNPKNIIKSQFGHVRHIVRLVRKKCFGGRRTHF
jgi:hypothetical protein